MQRIPSTPRHQLARRVKEELARAAAKYRDSAKSQAGMDSETATEEAALQALEQLLREHAETHEPILACQLGAQAPLFADLC